MGIAFKSHQLKPLGQALACPVWTLQISLRSHFSITQGESRWGDIPVMNATVRIWSQEGGTVLEGVANSLGDISFEIDPGFASDGPLYFSVTPAEGQEGSGPAGPGLVHATTLDEFRQLPPRMLREATGYVTIVNCQVVVDESFEMTEGADHASIFSLAADKIVIDWRPDFVRSPFLVERGGTPVDLIVLHHTDGDRRISSTLESFGGANQGPAEPNSQHESTHYVVDIDGFVVKMVPDELAANHAGPSIWQGQTGLNARSIGIEIVHGGTAVYEESQYEAIVDLVGRYLNNPAFPGITRHRIVYHSDIRAGNSWIIDGKTDCPGYMLDWRTLVEGWTDAGPYHVDRDALEWRVDEKYQGYFAGGAHFEKYDEDDLPRYGGADRSDRAGQRLIRAAQIGLATIGYSISRDLSSEETNGSADYIHGQRLTGEFDDATRYAVFKFKIRFMGLQESSVDTLHFDRATALALEAALMDLGRP